MFKANSRFFPKRGRTQLDSFTQNVHWTFGGAKEPDAFKNFFLSKFLPNIFCKELYSTGFIAVQFVSAKEFDSCESIVSVFDVFVELGQESTLLTTSKSLKPI